MEGKVALVTGATGGIGRSVAKGLAKDERLRYRLWCTSGEALGLSGTGSRDERFLGEERRPA